MSERGSRRLGGDRQRPLDHLPPGGNPGADPAGPAEPTGEPTQSVGGTGPGPAEPTRPDAPAQPAETTGVNVEGEALRGKATRSPAEVGTRPHLEGSEQGPA